MNPTPTSPHALSALIRRVTAPQAAAIWEAPRVLLEQTALTTGLTRRGWFAARVDRAPVFDKPTLLHALYQAGCFPGYFGFNWDALSDVLTDLSWLRAQERPAEGAAFILAHSAALAERSPDDYATLLDIIREAAVARQTAARPPLVLLIEQRVETAVQTAED